MKKSIENESKGKKLWNWSDKVLVYWERNWMEGVRMVWLNEVEESLYGVEMERSAELNWIE